MLALGPDWSTALCIFIARFLSTISLFLGFHYHYSMNNLLTLSSKSEVVFIYFSFSNRVFTEGTCKLLNLVISDLVDEDYVLYRRKQSISALVFGTTALLSKPGQTLAPLIGTWLLAKQTGHTIFHSKTIDIENVYESNIGDVKVGVFQVLVYTPIVCAMLQILLWNCFKLHGKRLKDVMSIRMGAEIGGIV